MVQSLLAERFNLAAHTESRDMAIYEMVLARSDGRLGEKLRVAGPDCAPMTMPPGMKPLPPPPAPPAGARGTPPPGCPTIFGNGFMSARRISMELLAQESLPDRPPHRRRQDRPDRVRTTPTSNSCRTARCRLGAEGAAVS